ncbi:MAG: DNA mismatch repair protein MutS [Clostridia bacterium]|nr:DNA mismatch repair protein MutS [Clostridia bacterium]
MTPIMEQYYRLKAEHKDHLLFFRLGDFYEMFFDDADIAARELKLTLTGRKWGQGVRAPMCGVPYHSAESYIKRLIEKGYKVAVCEQTTDPKQSKGLVEREVIRVVTPGTLIEDPLVAASDNNFIAAVFTSPTSCGAAFCDISTGEMHVCRIEGENEQSICDTLYKFLPKEVLLNRGSALNKSLMQFVKTRLGVSGEEISYTPDALLSAAALKEQFGDVLPDELMSADARGAASAAHILIMYLTDTQRGALSNLTNISFFEIDEYMDIDMSTMRNLELTGAMRGDKRGSLLWVLDLSRTPMGRRLIKKRIEMPLLDPARINARLDAVDELHKNPYILGEVCDALDEVYDIERLMSKVAYQRANARDLNALARSLACIPNIKETISSLSCGYIKKINSELYDLKKLYTKISAAITDEPSVQIKEGGIIRSGFDETLDRLRDIGENGKKYIAKLEADEREKTGIKNLKIAHNRVFGYYIEVTRSYYDLVPDGYIRKQTLANSERYTTKQLQEFENTVLGAHDRAIELEYEIFCSLRDEVKAEMRRIQDIASALSRLDAACALSEAALKYDYTRPVIHTGDELIIKEGRHPSVEKMNPSEVFVPNDVYLDCAENRTMIITGPNMAGKSTYMRQCAIITIMAQMGSFVPAKYAKIGVADKVFVRAGASDDLSAGQSTFMLEMSEVANILKNATSRSLLVFDEIGRGTSTYDGMAIARAVVEEVNSKERLGARAMFATHYHELSEMERDFDGIKNYNVSAVREHGTVEFLRKVRPGAADGSFGVEVAALAGVPSRVVRRAREVLCSLEEENAANAGKVPAPACVPPEYEQYRQICAEIIAINPDELTPMDALGRLYELKKRLKRK